VADLSAPKVIATSFGSSHPPLLNVIIASPYLEFDLNYMGQSTTFKENF